MGSTEEPVTGVEGVSSATHHGSAAICLLFLLEPQDQPRAWGRGKGKHSGGTAFGVDGTNHLCTALWIKNSLKPPVVLSAIF